MYLRGLAMSKASQQREKERAARKRRNGFATWEEFYKWQDEQRSVWLSRMADERYYSSRINEEGKREYIRYEDIPLKSPPSEWEDVIDIHQCLKINEN